MLAESPWRDDEESLECSLERKYLTRTAIESQDLSLLGKTSESRQALCEACAALLVF